MGQHSVLQRLFRLRKLEEETQRVTVELAVLIRNQMEAEAKAEQEYEREGKEELHQRMGDADTVARFAAAAEMENAGKRRQFVQRKLDAANATVQRLRAQLLSRRMARQQVESLVEREIVRVHKQELRRAQQSLDDWFNRRDSTAMADESGSKSRTPNSAHSRE